MAAPGPRVRRAAARQRRRTCGCTWCRSRGPGRWCRPGSGTAQAWTASGRRPSCGRCGWPAAWRRRPRWSPRPPGAAWNWCPVSARGPPPRPCSAATALPDAVSVGDYHLPGIVGHALAGNRDADDTEMLRLLEPYAGQRHRAARLILLSGRTPPRRAPRMTPGDIAALWTAPPPGPLGAFPRRGRAVRALRPRRLRPRRLRPRLRRHPAGSPTTADHRRASRSGRSAPVQQPAAPPAQDVTAP